MTFFRTCLLLHFGLALVEVRREDVELLGHLLLLGQRQVLGATSRLELLALEASTGMIARCLKSNPVICCYLVAQSRLEGVPGGLCLDELLGEALARLLRLPQVNLQLRRVRQGGEIWGRKEGLSVKFLS